MLFVGRLLAGWKSSCLQDSFCHAMLLESSSKVLLPHPPPPPFPILLSKLKPAIRETKARFLSFMNMLAVLQDDRAGLTVRLP